jgi:hypothetical protein
MGSYQDTILDKLRTVPGVGNLRAPGNEVNRAAFDIAYSRVNDRVIHTSIPTGSDEERGERETYPGLLVFATDPHVSAVVDDMKAVKEEATPAALEVYARRHGYYQHESGETRGLSYLEGGQQYITSEYTDPDGITREIVSPLLGQGTTLRSKYADLPLAEPTAVYGGGTTEQESRFSSVPQAPLLPNGEIDYAKVMEYHNTPQPSGRQAASYVPIGRKD